MTDKAIPLNWKRLQLSALESQDGSRKSSPPVHARKPDAGSAAKIVAESPKDFSRGYEEGLSAGHEEGFATGEVAGFAEGQQAANQLLSLASSLNQTLADFDQQIAEELLALALEIARQMLRQVVSVKPETILAVVQEALTQLPHHHAAIYLHPEDANLVRRYSGDQLSHAGHRINEDTQLYRGDVVIEANGAQVDATLATRWRRIVETLGSKTPWIDEEKT
jgi:flagellar assembly protein FliH